MNRDEIILRQAMVICENSQVHALKSKQVLLHHCDTDLMQEGVFIESAKVILNDLVKNLLSSGAVALSGGMAGDTAVDLMYAIERTRTVVQAYNAIQEAGQELAEFLSEIDRIPLNGNLDTITSGTERTLSIIASKIDSIGGEGLASEKSADLTKFSQVLVDEFLKFFKTTAKALSTWISTIIPDDGGNIGTFINVTLVGLVESAADKPLDTFLSVVDQLPSEYQGLVFDENALTQFLTEVCTSIADGIEEYGGGNLGGVYRALNKGQQMYFDFLGNYTPVGLIYKAGGYAGKKAGEFIGGEGSKAAKYGEAMFDPRKGTQLGRENFDALVEKFPNYIRTELIPQIPEAVQAYAQFMKYVVSFLHLLELVRTDKLKVVASAENYKQYLPMEDDFEMQQQMVAEIRRSLMMHQRRLIS